MASAPTTVRAFRDATPGDLEPLLRLERACYPPRQAYGREEYRYALTVARAANLLLDGPQGPIAFGGAFLHTGRKTGNVFTVNVHPEERGQGLGGRVVQALEARMLAAGMRRSVLEVNVENAAAIRLYESLDYVQVERLCGYYHAYPNRDAFRYAKDL